MRKKKRFILVQVASSNHRSRSEDIRGGALTGSLRFYNVQEYILHGRLGATNTYSNSGRSLGVRESDCRGKLFLYSVLENKMFGLFVCRNEKCLECVLLENLLWKLSRRV